MKKTLIAAALILAGGMAVADDNPIMQATEETQVCKLIGFMAQVANPDHEQECMDIAKGTKAMLLGVLQAGRPFYIVADGGYQWWIADPYYWRKLKEGEQ